VVQAPVDPDVTACALAATLRNLWRAAEFFSRPDIQPNEMFHVKVPYDVLARNSERLGTLMGMERVE